jgi:MYXO-CTERM domain-containing protein
MTRKCAYLLWLAALMVSWGPRASAQVAGTGGTVSSAPTAEDGNFNVDLIKAGGKDFNPQERTGRPIGLEACIQGSIEVTLSQLPNSAAYPYLEVWYSTGSGNCQMGDRATRTSGSQNCTKLSHEKESEQVNSYRTFNTEIDIKPVCRLNEEQTEGAEGPQTLYFLLLQSKGSAEQAQFYRAFTIKIDTHAPTAPKITLAGSGQTDIKLEWELPVSSTNFWVAADYSNGALSSDGDAGVTDGGVGSNDCNSNYLRAGDKFDPDARPTGLYVRNTESISTSWSFDGALFQGVKKVPVVVVAEDLAGNLSLQSEVRCITVEPTTGFWERYKAADGEAEVGCACAAPGAPRHGRNAVLATPVALLLVGAYARRRIRRRAR